MKNFQVYKSSAGSGKTYTLVKEYLKLVLTNEDFSRYRNILAITFTNKAANEMKERVLLNLKKLAAREDSNEYDSFLMDDYVAFFGIDKQTIKSRATQVFKSVLHNYSDLKVSTIDKFTHKIIRAFAKDLALQPDFDIEMDVDSVLQNAINAIINEAGENEELSNILLDTLHRQIDDEKSWDIERNIFDFSKELIKEVNQPYFNKLKEITHDDFNGIKKELSSLKNKYLKQIKDGAKKALDLFASQNIVKEELPRGTTLAFFNNIYKEVFKGIFETPKTVLAAINDDVWLKKSASLELVGRMEVIKKNVIIAYQSILTASEHYFLYKLIDENIDNLILVNEIYKAIATIKEENGVLLISDFNKIISDEIKDQPAPFIYEKIGERYKNIMIDEFQDTSVLQWQNLLPLVDNSLALGEKNFLVGDAKQAIYRFRGGKVEQFVELPKIFEHNNDPLLLERQQALTYNYEGENLPKNYRSHKQIIEFNNWLFTSLQNYLTNKNKVIYDNHEQEFDVNKTNGLVHVSFIDHKETEDINEDYLVKTLAFITECLADGYLLSDIAILVRNHKASTLIADYLIENNCDVITSESLVIKNNAEVNFIINFLRYSINKNNNAAKLALVKYLIPPNDISSVLLNNIKEVSKYRKEIAITSVFEQLNKTIEDVLTLEISLYDLAEHIIRSFELDTKNANPYLVCLLDKLNDFTLKSNNTQDFITWWDEKGEKVSINTPEDNNAVSIMTIHKSKGLQFPVVISPFTNWKLKIKPTNSWIALKESIGKLKTTIIPLKKEIGITKYAYLLEEELETNIIDNFNLLYVSLTRPEERLYIISDTNIISKKENNANLISMYLLNACRKSEGFNSEKNELIIGERISKKQKQKTTKQKDINLKQIISTNWRERLNMSSLYKKHWTEGTYRDKIEYGNLIHSILSNIETQKDILPTIKDFTNKGLIKASQVEGLEKEIIKILQLPLVKEWFSGKGVVKNEKEIITKKGEILIPDKVILFNNKTIVIDFKTGDKNNKYKKQINTYGSVLEDMKCPNVEKYLLYTKFLEVEKVI